MKFFIEINDERFYDKIKIIDFNRKTLEEKYKKDTKINVKCMGLEGDKAIWSIET